MPEPTRADKNRFIAEACGWRIERNNDAVYKWRVVAPSGKPGAVCASLDAAYTWLPQYFTSRDACADAIMCDDCEAGYRRWCEDEECEWAAVGRHWHMVPEKPEEVRR